DQKATDLLAVQKDIAHEASEQILPKMNLKETPKPEVPPKSEAPPKPEWQASVPDLMVLAKNYQQSAVSTEDWDKVVGMYERVVEADPESALAHARLANALFYQRKDVELAEKHARLALSLDPDLSEGHTTLGLLLWSRYRRGAGTEFQRAIELDPKNPEAL